MTTDNDTTTVDANTLVVDADLPESTLEKVKQFEADRKGAEASSIVVNPVESDEVPQIKGTNFDAEPEKAKTGDLEPEKEKTETPETTSEEKPSEKEEPSAQDETIKAFLEENKLSEKELFEKLLETNHISIDFKGKKRDLSMHDIKSAMGREDSFQRRHDKLATSDEMRLGTLMKAAQDGDAEAQKKVQNLLIKSVKAEDADGLTDKLQDVKGEFDEDKKLTESQKQDQFDTYFDDVKDDVDFKETFAKIEPELKSRMPEKVFAFYRDRPDTQRTMYDLVASGRGPELFDALDEALRSLPFEKQLEIKSDPEAYGTAFLTVIEQQNAKIAKPETKVTQEDEVDDGVASVSIGSKGRNPPSADSTKPKFLEMSKEDFNKIRKEQGLEQL